MNEFNVENFQHQTEQSPTVFIANKSGHDFSPSSKYGKPVYVTKGLIGRYEINYMTRRWWECLKSSTKEDYILITSLTNLTVVGAAIFGWLHGGINLLLYRNGKYIARSIVFANLEETKKEAQL